MLSRVAECLYWMGRYSARAENIARIVNVNLQLMLDLPTRFSQRLTQNWVPIAASLGDDGLLRKQTDQTDSATVIQFLVFDRQNPNSILRCVAGARENARSVREQISTEMWEQINRTYLWIISQSARQFYEKNQYEFFQRTIKTLQLLQAITDDTMAHGEGWEFIQIGKLLERGEKTSRVLDDKYHILQPQHGSRQGAWMQWVGVLRSCSARQVYQRIYHAEVEPLKVAELLLLNESFPRSVRFCVQNLDQSLRRLSGVAPGHFSNRAEKISGRLLADLSFSSIEDFSEIGLHKAMDDLQIKLNQIGDAIYDSYIHHPEVIEPGRREMDTVSQPQQ